MLIVLVFNNLHPIDIFICHHHWRRTMLHLCVRHLQCGLNFPCLMAILLIPAWLVSWIYHKYNIKYIVIIGIQSLVNLHKWTSKFVSYQSIYNEENARIKCLDRTWILYSVLLVLLIKPWCLCENETQHDPSEIILLKFFMSMASNLVPSSNNNTMPIVMEDAI